MWRPEHFPFKQRGRKKREILKEKLRYRQTNALNFKVCIGQQNGVRVADPRDCRRYFSCSNQQRSEGECKLGELFEVNLARCVNEKVVNCGSRANGKNDNISHNDGVPTTVRIYNILYKSQHFLGKILWKMSLHENVLFPLLQICVGMPTGTIISNPQFCERYYKCQNNQRNDLTCPPNQDFDITSNQCRTSSSVNCGNRKSLNNNTQQQLVHKE